MKRRISKSDKMYSTIINYDVERRIRQIDKELVLCTCSSEIISALRHMSPDCKDCDKFSRCAVIAEKTIMSCLN